MRTSNENNETIKVTIGRFGQAPQILTLPVDSTVEGALQMGGHSFVAGQVFVNGQNANAENLLDDNDVVNIVTPKEGGYVR